MRSTATTMARRPRARSPGPVLRARVVVARRRAGAGRIGGTRAPHAALRGRARGSRPDRAPSRARRPASPTSRPRFRARNEQRQPHLRRCACSLLGRRAHRLSVAGGGAGHRGPARAGGAGGRGGRAPAERGIVFVEAGADVAGARDEVRWVDELATRETRVRIAAIVAQVAVDRGGETDAALAALDGHARVRGIRHLIQAHPEPDYCARPEFISGVRRVGERGWTFDSWRLLAGTRSSRRASSSCGRARGRRSCSTTRASRTSGAAAPIPGGRTSRRWRACPTSSASCRAWSPRPIPRRARRPRCGHTSIIC